MAKRNKPLKKSKKDKKNNNNNLEELAEELDVNLNTRKKQKKK